MSSWAQTKLKSLFNNYKVPLNVESLLPSPQAMMAALQASMPPGMGNMPGMGASSSSSSSSSASKKSVPKLEHIPLSIEVTSASKVSGASSIIYIRGKKKVGFDLQLTLQFRLMLLGREHPIVGNIDIHELEDAFVGTGNYKFPFDLQITENSNAEKKKIIK